MHFYDAVCADPPKALTYAKQVKALAQKALDEASDVLAFLQRCALILSR